MVKIRGSGLLSVFGVSVSLSVSVLISEIFQFQFSFSELSHAGKFPYQNSVQ